MRKKWLAFALAAVLGTAVISGCAAPQTQSAPAPVQEEAAAEEEETASEEAAEEQEAAEAEAEVAEAEAEGTEAAEAEAESTEAEAAEAETEGSEAEAAEAEAESTEAEGDDAGTSDVQVRVGSLKGPTTMGLVNLMKASEDGESEGNYTFKMATQPDEIVADIAGGNIDIALVPANLASNLYKKTEGGVAVININTLGVLDCVTGDETIKSVADLAGRTLITTGQGATPEYSIRYLLKENGVEDCTLEFKSEATEIAAILKEDPSQVAVLPQPFATAAQVQNEALHTAFSLTDEWDKVAGGKSQLLTGVTIVRKAFLEEHPEAVALFVSEQSQSVEKALADVDATSELIAQYGILEKAPVAKKALPFCNIACIVDEEMQTALSGYLEVLFEQDPKSVGGSLPGDDFYWHVGSFTAK